MGEDYISKQEIVVEKAVTIKHLLSLSKRGYEKLAKMMSDHVRMPSRDSVTAFEKAITPSPIPWLGGTRYALKDCIGKAVLEIFTVNEVPPEAVPKTAWAKIGIGFDAAGGYPYRKGQDIVLDTTHR